MKKVTEVLTAALIWLNAPFYAGTRSMEFSPGLRGALASTFTQSQIRVGRIAACLTHAAYPISKGDFSKVFDTMNI